nr:carboxypeptidase B-like [Onthophagus taurus]
MSYLDNLSQKYGYVSVESLGKTFEGRDIKVVKISTGGNFDKPAIFIDAGLSPREWIGPAQALYIIDYLLDKSNQNLIETVDWYILPLVNPDGYEYSHTVQRLWKKNRAKHSEKIFGTYINRNFDVDWGNKLSKDDTESWNYHGKNPFSEPESKAIKKLIEENVGRIQLYLSIHSFGPTILYPYGFTHNQPENIKLHKYLAEKASQAILDSSEIVYRTRASCGKKFFYSGSSIDWAVGVVGIPLGYTIELPSPGYLGFDYPIAKIESVLKQFIPALEVFHDFIKTSFYHPEEIEEEEILAVVVENYKNDKNEEEENVASVHKEPELISENLNNEINDEL